MIRNSLTLAVAAVCVSVAFAQPAATKQDASGEGITRAQADAILNELKEMRLLLEKMVKPPAAPQPVQPKPAVVSWKMPAGTQMLGNEHAAVTMVEYFDLQCAFCKRFDETTFPEIRKNLIDTGKVRYYSRAFPLDMHPNARKAAVAADCAAEAGKYWPMRDLLVLNATNLGSDAILGYAKTAGLDTSAFGACFASTKYDAAIASSLQEGLTLGVQGTPTFLIGKSTPDGVVGTLIVGAVPYSTIEAEVNKLSAK